MPSSMRIYYESRHPLDGVTGSRPAEPLKVPTGIAVFPKEISLPPRKWVEARYNVTHWTEMPHGGHFAALEEPKLLVEDVRAFFRGLRKQRSPGAN
jgi:pimeloyl-ACP methyl ester carboxylesterase